MFLKILISIGEAEVMDKNRNFDFPTEFQELHTQVNIPIESNSGDEEFDSI